MAIETEARQSDKSMSNSKFALQVPSEGQIKLNGILYRVRETRGKRNRELTIKDLGKNATTSVESLIGKPVKYEHGKDKRFGHVYVGYVETARILNTGVIFIEVSIYHNQPNLLPLDLEEIIRQELRDGTLQSFSMYWDSTSLGEHNGKVVYNPEDRVFREVSLCQEGFYPEAKLVSFAASATSHSSGISSKLEVLTCYRR